MRGDVAAQLGRGGLPLRHLRLQGSCRCADPTGLRSLDHAVGSAVGGLQVGVVHVHVVRRYVQVNRFNVQMITHHRPLCCCLAVFVVDVLGKPTSLKNMRAEST